MEDELVATQDPPEIGIANQPETACGHINQPENGVADRPPPARPQKPLIACSAMYNPFIVSSAMYKATPQPSSTATGASATQPSSGAHNRKYLVVPMDEASESAITRQGPLVVSSSVSKAHHLLYRTRTHASLDPMNMTAPGESMIIPQKPLIVSSSMSMATPATSSFTTPVSGGTLRKIFTPVDISALDEAPTTRQQPLTVSSSMIQPKPKTYYMYREEEC